MTTHAQAPDVFRYLDYRGYLRDFYLFKKATRPGFSYRAFSRRAKLGSPNHLKRVIDGERNLTLDMAARFAEALDLQGEAAEYFVALVQLGQADTSEERDRAFTRLRSFRAFRRTRKLDLAHADYHATWFIPAVRELAGREDFRADPDWIARRLVPQIKPSEAQTALDTLVALGLLQEQGEQLVQSEPVVTTGPELHAVHIARYHRTMMERASVAIDLLPPTSRDISSLTLLVSEGGVSRLKQKVQRFRRELLEDALSDAGATQVVQLNFQLFPLTVEPDQEPAP